MKKSIFYGVAKRLLIFSFPILWLFVLGARTCAETETTTTLVRILSQPVTMPAGKVFTSTMLDKITDRAYLKNGETAVPSSRSFSQIYSDMLARYDFVVRRKNYEEEDDLLKHAAKTIFRDWSISSYRKGKSVLLDSAEETLDSSGECVLPANKSETLYQSSIRVFDYVFDIPCVLDRFPSGRSRRAIQTFLREIGHNNLLNIHGAQELFISQYTGGELSRYVVLNKNEFQMALNGSISKVTYEQILVERPWMDEAWWSIERSTAFNFLKNAHGFNRMKESESVSNYCFIRELSLLCHEVEDRRYCRTESARCESISWKVLDKRERH
jgi:hypothetical protein